MNAELIAKLETGNPLERCWAEGLKNRIAESDKGESETIDPAKAYAIAREWLQLNVYLCAYILLREPDTEHVRMVESLILSLPEEPSLSEIRFLFREILCRHLEWTGPVRCSSCTMSELVKRAGGQTELSGMDKVSIRTNSVLARYLEKAVE
ncbi:MAG: hypothetical protein ACKOBV_11175 [Candidatus Kapaibacterium sp.]